MNRKRRVHIVDDHPIVRRGLKRLFDAEPDFTVCGEAEDATLAQELIGTTDPDIVIVDITLKGTSGLDLTKQLNTYHPKLPVLVISMYAEQLYAERSLRAGASGYISKYESADELLRVSREILNSNAAGQPSLPTNGVAEQDGSHNGSPTPVQLLTDREFEVFLQIGQGLAPRHISEQLNLSINTIEVYRQRLKTKLSLNSAAELTHYAVQWYQNRHA
jgi:DNA-binding NarL/FixJ family response regulator